MKRTKKILSMLMIFVMISMMAGGLVMAQSSTGVSASSVLIANEYIKFGHAAGSDYYVETVMGDADNTEDDGQPLLYPYTSYATIRIDGTNHVFSPESFMVYEGDLEATASVTYDGVQVDMMIRIIENSYTGQADLVEWDYQVTNNNTDDREIGVRIMFDTMLGNNDSAPFRVPGYGDLNTVTYFEGSEIPEYWQAFDDLSDPTVTAQGTLYVNGSMDPDRLLFTNWSDVSSHSWEGTKDIGSSNGDSAVCIYFDPRSYTPGTSRHAKTYYGLSTMERTESADLSLALTGAESLDYISETDSYSPNPFTVTAYVEAQSDAISEDVSVTLELPEGLSLATTGASLSYDLGDLSSSDGIQQVSWQVLAARQLMDTQLTYAAMVTSSNTENITSERTIDIPAVEFIEEVGYMTLTVESVESLELISDETYDPNPFDIVSYVSNDADFTIENVRLELELPDGLELSTSTAALEVALGNLEPGQQSDSVSWSVLAALVTSTTVYDVDVRAYADNADTNELEFQINVPAIVESSEEEEEEDTSTSTSSSSKKKDKEYEITAVSDPEGIATFSGTGDDFERRDDYEVTYELLDDSYTFVRWEGGEPSGTVAKEDIDLVAVFEKIEEVIEEEDVPESDGTDETEETTFDASSETTDSVGLDLDIDDAEIPKTGGVPLAAMQAAGALVAGIGLMIRKRKN